MILTYYPHVNHTHKLKVMEFLKFQNSKYVSNFQNSCSTCEWGVILYMTYKTKL